MNARTGTTGRPQALAGCALLILLAAALRLWLALGVTDLVLVDDAYITLRYARNAVDHGALVYNLGEPVFGVTSPLWAFVTTALFAACGAGGIESAATGLGILLWSWAALRLAQLTAPPYRGVALSVFLFAPVFVDNQMLGMETPLLVWLAVHAIGAAQEGRLRCAAAWAGWLVIARPEGVLFAPALLAAASSARGWRATWTQLRAPGSLALLTGPAAAWIAFALWNYGTVVPQSMVAKSGWNSAHYDALGTLENAWLGLARLTFLPFIDYLPRAVALGLTSALAALIAAIALANVRRGTPGSRVWLIVYTAYVAFYVLGKGATEASWYAVPSSVALLLAAEPLLSEPLARWRTGRSRLATAALATSLAALSIAYVARRAPLLHSYVEGYGACAARLEAVAPGGDQRVLIGEIGVFGFRTSHTVIDVGALVSPELLPLKNARLSLVAIARATRADWLVISDVALERNHYPSVGAVWATDEERAWLAQAEEVAHERDKRLLRLRPEGLQSQRP